MSEALSLFNYRRNGESIQARFERFHADNPQVYAMLREYALKDVERGARTCSIDLYVNLIRWRTRMQTRGDDFKMNNSFRSRYARMLMDNEPTLRDKFEIRTLQSA